MQVASRNTAISQRSSGDPNVVFGSTGTVWYWLHLELYHRSLDIYYSHRWEHIRIRSRPSNNTLSNIIMGPTAYTTAGNLNLQLAGIAATFATDELNLARISQQPSAKYHSRLLRAWYSQLRQCVSNSLQLLVARSLRSIRTSHRI